jgi:hypothetical protein
VPDDRTRAGFRRGVEQDLLAIIRAAQAKARDLLDEAMVTQTPGWRAAVLDLRDKTSPAAGLDG